MGDVIKRFFYFELWWPLCSAERNLFFAILVAGHSRNIPVKLFQNPFTGLGEDVS